MKFSGASEKVFQEKLYGTINEHAVDNFPEFMKKPIHVGQDASFFIIAPFEITQLDILA